MPSIRALRAELVPAVVDSREEVRACVALGGGGAEELGYPRAAWAIRRSLGGVDLSGEEARRSHADTIAGRIPEHERTTGLDEIAAPRHDVVDAARAQPRPAKDGGSRGSGAGRPETLVDVPVRRESRRARGERGADPSHNSGQRGRGGVSHKRGVPGAQQPQRRANGVVQQEVARGPLAPGRGPRRPAEARPGRVSGDASDD